MTENTQSLIIQLKDVNKSYATGDGPFIALNNINLDIYQGEFLGVTGKSGAGKTTLLNMISGVSELTSGEVLFLGDKNGKSSANGSGRLSIHSLSEDELAAWRGSNMGIVYQSFELMPSLNLIENVMLPQDFSGSYRPKASKEKALECFGSALNISSATIAARLYSFKLYKALAKLNFQSISCPCFFNTLLYILTAFLLSFNN